MELILTPDEVAGLFKRSIRDFLSEQASLFINESQVGDVTIMVGKERFHTLDQVSLRFKVLPRGAECLEEKEIVL